MARTLNPSTIALRGSGRRGSFRRAGVTWPASPQSLEVEVTAFTQPQIDLLLNSEHDLDITEVVLVESGQSIEFDYPPEPVVPAVVPAPVIDEPTRPRRGRGGKK